jgi:cell division protein DivIC
MNGYQPSHNRFNTNQPSHYRIPQQPPSPKNRSGARLRIYTTLFITLLLLGWGFSVWGDQEGVLAEKKEGLEEMKQLVNEANEEQMDLIYQLRRLEDEDYIAEIARRDYFMSNEGEIIFIVPKKKK